MNTEMVRDWIIPRGDPWFKPHLLQGEIDEVSIRVVLDAVEQRGRGFAVAVDGGAHIGTWTRPLSQRFERVLAFEPNPWLAQLNRKNLELIGAGNVRVYEAALWRECTVLSLRNDESGNSGQAFITSFDDNEGRQLMTPCVSIDAFELPALDLLKLDIEGAEIAALIGAGNTIVRHKPIVVIEQNCASDRYGVERRAAQNWLASFGMVELARVEFMDDMFNVVMGWVEN